MARTKASAMKRKTNKAFGPEDCVCPPMSKNTKIEPNQSILSRSRTHKNNSLNQSMRRSAYDKSNRPSFARYIHRVLKEEKNEFGVTSISRNGMYIMDSLCIDVFNRIAKEASVLARHAKKHTLQQSDIQSAVNLLMPGDMGKMAHSEASKAMRLYNLSSMTGQGTDKSSKAVPYECVCPI